MWRVRSDNNERKERVEVKKRENEKASNLSFLTAHYFGCNY